MSKTNKKTKSDFNLFSKSLLSPIDISTYYIYCPDIEGKLEKMGEFETIVDALLWVYGINEFTIENKEGLFYSFNSEDFTIKQIHNAGFIEAFDFVTHNLLTDYELNNFKIRIRNYKD